MTPVKLQMKAFGPYVEQAVLNFEAGLGNDKIFLIHGATGAGKTTILDGICYALYGETSGKACKVEDMRSKGVPNNVDTEVEFTFRLGAETYRLWRGISYHPKRKDNKYQKQAELYRDDRLLAAKDGEIKRKVTELLGFSAEQFRQVILLPQGEFNKFLSADANDRQKVLNVLFDTEPYQKVEAALEERAKVAASEKDSLEKTYTELDNRIKDAGSQTVEEAAEKLSAAKQKVTALKKNSDAAQALLTDGKILAGKFADLKRITSELNAAQIQLAEAEKSFATAQAEYLRREAETNRRKELDTLAHDLEEVQKTLSDLDGKKSALKAADEKLARAKKIFTDCEQKAKRYEARLAELKAEELALAGADVRFEQAKTTLDRAVKRDALLREISRLKGALDLEQEKFSVVKEKLKAAQIELTRLQIVNSAAYLATQLKDGEPCPVCGSLEHPAVIADAIPTADEIKAAQRNVERLTHDNSQQERTVAKMAGELSSRENQLKDFDDVPDSQAAKNIHEDAHKKSAALAECRRRIEKGNRCVEENNSALKAADEAQKSANSLVAKLAGEIDGLQSKVPEKYRDNRQLLAADLNAAQIEFNQLDDAWKAAQEQFRKAETTKSARTATLANIQKNFDALQAAVEGKTPPDLDSLKEQADTARASYDSAIGEEARLEKDFNALKENFDKRAAVKAKLDAAEKISEMWRGLSDVANATGRGEAELKISFQRYYLSTMFSDVVTEANNRLLKMSNGRYLFQMKDAGRTMAKSAGLNFEIWDESTGAARPVETLSGGESFLASLSLALGLAAVVQNRVGGIQLDTIFIDEGFGSLDMEALDHAVSTIIEQSGGRLVGIISHVEELKSQIPVRLEVKAGKAGSRARFER